MIPGQGHFPIEENRRHLKLRLFFLEEKMSKRLPSEPLKKLVA
jgi:hypothetical protein